MLQRNRLIQHPNLKKKQNKKQQIDLICTFMTKVYNNRDTCGLAISRIHYQAIISITRMNGNKHWHSFQTIIDDNFKTHSRT